MRRSSEWPGGGPANRVTPWLGALVATAITIFPACAQSISEFAIADEPLSWDEALKVYAVNVVKTTPFQEPFTGYGIYLGRGGVLTAAHVIGRWGVLKDTHVLIAGLKFPAKIIKEGSLERTDLTLLSIDESALPSKLQLRRNPICHGPLRVGAPVIAVVPERAQRTHILSPNWIDIRYRKRFGTLTSELATMSGSGIFDLQKKCLLGIMSRRVDKLESAWEGGRMVRRPAGTAGYFVPSWDIREFLPSEFRF